MTEHTFLVAFNVEGSTREAARFWLHEHLPEPDGIVTSVQVTDQVVGRHKLAISALQAATDLYSAAIMDGQTLGGAPRNVKDTADELLEWLEQRS